MPDYFAFYLESTIICLVIFGIILVNDLISVDRQEKQIKFDIALVVFMLYFVSDMVWASIDAEIIQKTKLSVIVVNFMNCVLMAGITYAWLEFVMAFEKIPNRDRDINKIAVAFPFIISMVILAAAFLFFPDLMLDGTLTVRPAYYIFLIAVPCIYVFVVVLYTVKKAIKEDTPSQKRRHLYIGFFPFMVICGGLVQVVLLPELPIFCYCCVILMLILYIQSMKTRISTDPLTNLNNRGRLLQFISQKSNYIKKDRATFVVMIDINGFKKINDTYGHAEGDTALVIISDTLKETEKSNVTPLFTCRYGGDEFLLILFADTENDLVSYIDGLRDAVKGKCVTSDKPYVLSISAGYEKISDDGKMQEYIQTADKNLYNDKKRQKSDS